MFLQNIPSLPRTRTSKFTTCIYYVNSDIYFYSDQPDPQQPPGGPKKTATTQRRTATHRTALHRAKTKHWRVLALLALAARFFETEDTTPPRHAKNEHHRTTNT